MPARINRTSDFRAPSDPARIFFPHRAMVSGNLAIGEIHWTSFAARDLAERRTFCPNLRQVEIALQILFFWRRKTSLSGGRSGFFLFGFGLFSGRRFSIPVDGAVAGTGMAAAVSSVEGAGGESAGGGTSGSGTAGRGAVVAGTFFG